MHSCKDQVHGRREAVLVTAPLGKHHPSCQLLSSKLRKPKPAGLCRGVTHRNLQRHAHSRPLKVALLAPSTVCLQPPSLSTSVASLKSGDSQLGNLAQWLKVKCLCSVTHTPHTRAVSYKSGDSQPGRGGCHGPSGKSLRWSIWAITHTAGSQGVSGGNIFWNPLS